LDEERFAPRQVQWFVTASKDEGLRASRVEAHDEFTRRMKDIYAAYDEQCNREGVVDFAELLLRSYELLSGNETLRAHYHARFRHVLVDEFQDTNRLQYAWLKLLAAGTDATPKRGDDNALFAVGDDDQSIYKFRGASAANMQDLQRDFAIERVIKLEQNYRSHGHILDAANALIGHNRRRLGKNLWTAESKGEPLRVFEAATDFEESAFIVDEARALRAEGVMLSQIAVLYRSNAQSRVLEHALFSAGVPYRVYGGLRFFERQEVKHALAYLRLLASSDDDGALMRIINFPARGIGARTLEQLSEFAKEHGGSLWAAAQARAGGGKKRDEGGGMRAEGKNEQQEVSSSSPIPHPSSLKGIPAFVTLIEQMRDATNGLTLPEVIEYVIEASGLKAHYKAEREGADRLENLAELINAAAAFVAERDVQPAGEAAGVDEPDELTAFLAHAALEAGDHQAEAGTDALQLMTVHSAKGLEFHSVFVSGLEEGLFPHENSLTEADGIEEERRLMYVALTRARRRLYLSFAQSRMLHGQTRYGIASRFFHEIPEALLRRIQPVSRARDSLPGKSTARSASHPSPITHHSSLAPESPWRIGQSVVHVTFGAGVIVSAEGRGADARVQVKFRSGGLKWLMLEYAKLIPA
jgi:DNA helicase-2/ATP-dependent DNA helicase PcrA